MGNCFSSGRHSDPRDEPPPMNGFPIVMNTTPVNPIGTPNLGHIENPPFSGRIYALTTNSLTASVFATILPLVQAPSAPMAPLCQLLPSRMSSARLEPRSLWLCMTMMPGRMRTWASRKGSIWKSSMTLRVIGGWPEAKSPSRKATSRPTMWRSSSPLKLKRKSKWNT